MNPADQDELAKISKWLRAQAADLRRHCSARRAAADCMRTAMGAELTVAARLGHREGDRAVQAMTVREAKETARIDTRIADKLEAEAFMLAEWAQTLDHIAAEEANAAR